jgi:hypothetical protein
MVQAEYVPGVCNIGPEEIARRRNFGWAALAVTVAVFVVLVWAKVSPWWRLVLFLPAMGSASGFLQAQLHFCAGFSRLGVFNFGPLGEKNKVVDEDARIRDRRRGNQISLYAAVIGAIVSLVAVLVG